MSICAERINMPRPQKQRTVQEPPKIQGLKPIGVPSRFLENVVLSIDEYEAIRIADYEGLDQQKAADIMEISRPTFTRLIEKARKKVADCIVDAKELVIDGGNYSFIANVIQCYDCGNVFRFDVPSNVPVLCPSCGSANIVHLNQQFGRGMGLGREGRGRRRRGRGGW